MKKFILFWIVTALLTNQSYCSRNITGPIDRVIQYYPEDLVALTAVFNETDDDGRPLERLVLLDYYEPTHFKFVTEATYYTPLSPKFSPDKREILFGDEAHKAMDAGPQIALFNIQESNIQLLTYADNLPVNGIDYIWKPDKSGFYFSYIGPFGIVHPLLSYQFSPPEIDMIHGGLGISVYPAAFINSTTFIVFSNDSLTTGLPHGFYLMDNDGNYLSRVDNPHLLARTKNGVLVPASNIDWNNELGLLVYSEFFPNPNNSKISVSSLDGTYYISYTTGKFRDINPVWGPEGKTILFERKPLYSIGFTTSRIMIIDCKTEEVSEFVQPQVIGNAVSLRFPDY